MVVGTGGGGDWKKSAQEHTKERGESDAAPRKNASLNCFGALQPLFTPSLPAYLPPAHSSTLQREQAKRAGKELSVVP